jgi:hypothetical protein
MDAQEFAATMAKGEPSPNPSGRPRRLPISDTYALFAPVPIPESIRKAMKRRGIPIEPGATFADAIVLQVWMKAMDGDPKVAKEVRESIEGKAGLRPADPEDNEPVTIHVVYDKEEKNSPPEPEPDAGRSPKSKQES